MIDIGRLDRRITVQRRSSTLDGYGQEIDVWSDVARVWASIKPIGGREKMRSMVIDANISTTVAVRYRADFAVPTVTDAFRIVYGSRIFNVVGSRDVGEGHKHIIFDCSEGTVIGQ